MIEAADMVRPLVPDSSLPYPDACRRVFAGQISKHRQGMFDASTPVFCYHRVGIPGGMAMDLFRDHLDAIDSRGFTIAPLSRLIAALEGREAPLRRAVVLTFDDCTLDHYALVAPELAARGVSGSFFAISDFIADAPARDAAECARLLDPTVCPTTKEAFRRALSGDVSFFLNAGELQAMERDFGMEVHAHTSRHQACFRNARRVCRIGDAISHWTAPGVYYPGGVPRDLDLGLPEYEHASAYACDGLWPAPPELSGELGMKLRKRSCEERAAFCREDFARCKARLEQVLGRPETVMCWPWGQSDDVAEEALRATGYRAALSLGRGPNILGTSPFRIHRVGVGHRKSPTWVRSRLLMYGSPTLSRVFAKRAPKKDELRGVLYVTHSDKGSGGARQMINNALELRAAGLDVVVLCPDGAVYAHELAQAGVEVVAAPRGGSVLGLARRIRALAAERGVGVAHAFHGKAGRAALFARLFSQGLRVFFNRGVIFKPSRAYALWGLLGAEFVCNSAEARRMLMSVGIPGRKVHVALNAFTPKPVPERVGDRSRSVLYVGGSKPYKGLDVFTAMAARIAAYFTARGGDAPEFRAVGVTGPSPWMVKRDAPGGELPRYLGRLPHDEALAAIVDASVMVISSREESLPNTLLEAFNAGTPVVSAAVGGIPDVVKDGVNGMLCPSGDDRCMAEKTMAVLDDPALAKRLAEAGRWLVTRYLTPERKGLVLMRIYSGEAMVEEIPEGFFAAGSGERSG